MTEEQIKAQAEAEAAAAAKKEQEGSDDAEVVLPSKEEIAEIVNETVAKYYQNQQIREKRFNLSGSAEDAAKVVEGKKWGSTVKFLNAFVQGDTQTLHTLHGTRVKALNETTGTAGGFLVPEEFETQVLMYMDEYSDIRRNATVLPMNTDVKRLNALTAKVSVAYTDELASITASQSTFGEPVLTARKLAGITTMSEELLEDSEIALVDNLARQFAERMAQKEQSEFVSGVVSGSEGLLTVSGVTNVTMSGSTFASITWDNLADMEAALFAINKVEARNAKFYMSMTAYNALRKLKTSSGGDYFNMPAVPSQANPATAWGHEIVVLNEFPTATATATKFVVFADLKQHAFIGDRRGLRMTTHSEGTVDGINLIQQDAQALKVTKRTAFTTALQNGIITLSTNT